MKINPEYITRGREPFFEIARKYANPAGQILDVGCGDGAFARYLGRDDIFLVDGNPETITALRPRYKNCYLATLPQLPFGSVTFDLIHISHVIEHLPPAMVYDLLKECDRCLKAGGFLVVSAPLLNSNFYDDLSHLKPYNPFTIEKYLCLGNPRCATRPLISSAYRVVERATRYNQVTTAQFWFVINAFITRLITGLAQLVRRLLRAVRIFKIQETGFTLVLKKGVVENAP